MLLDDGIGRVGGVVEADVADAVLGALLETQARDFVGLSDYEQRYKKTNCLIAPIRVFHWIFERVALGRLIGREMLATIVQTPAAPADAGPSRAKAQAGKAGRQVHYRITAMGNVSTAATCLALLQGASER